MPPPALRHGTFIALFAVGVGACGGGAPLLHPAQVLSKGSVTAGAGLSGQPVLLDLPSTPKTTASNAEIIFQERSIGPAIAPWIGARIGLTGSDEAGLTYSGRALRLDGRHAFTLSKQVALSLGAGAEVLLTGRHDPTGAPRTFAGGGLDMPLLLGWMSTGGLYAGWIGPRFGVTWMRGETPPLDGSTARALLSGRDLRAGLVAGLRLGFRHVHVSLELGGDWHAVAGKIGDIEVSFGQLSLTPAGALLFSF